MERIFIHAGYPCVVYMTDKGTRRGYVGVKRGHPYFAQGASREENAEVFASRAGLTAHGGVTFAGELPEFGAGNLWFFGFSCDARHDACDIEAMDEVFCGFVPAGTLLVSRTMMPSRERKVRSLEYVMDECRKLAGQLKAADRAR